ncbi:MAG: UDP-N-acetylmuramate dehydrogenase [Clostridia bacterium]|nr:UDP-N-acetylmuramate dehydrogenase [Clostridia bacterium]
MINNIEIKYDEKLSDYSSIKIGGKAKIMMFPKTVKEAVEILNFARKTGQKIFVLGNGSNVLFDDNGFDGIVINIKNFNKIKLFRSGAYVGAGVKLFYLNIKLQQTGLSGIEWSYGIPASVGGAIFMNAGCFGHEVGDVVEYVDVIKQGELARLKRNQILFDYRKTSLDDCVIIGVKLKLKKSSPQQIKESMDAFFDKKRMSQPCDAPSLGSVFKRINIDGETVYPAKLIDTLGLKGVKIGGAEISQKHAGFIVNTGSATSSDYKALVSLIERKCHEVGVDLQREVIYL